MGPVFSGDGGQRPSHNCSTTSPGFRCGGRIYIPIRQTTAFAGSSRRCRVCRGNLVIASDDGTELYRFDAAGRRHIDTIHALTGALRHAFGYDAANRLVSVTDADGNITTIERDSAGIPTAILSPYGQRTTLTVDASGYLATVANPAGDVHRMAYTTGGLLTEFTYPKGGASSMIYDARATDRDSDAAGGAHTRSHRTYTAPQARRSVARRYQVDDLLTGNQAHNGIGRHGRTATTPKSRRPRCRTLIVDLAEVRTAVLHADAIPGQARAV
jgi:YD repeat-containing protein